MLVNYKGEAEEDSGTEEFTAQANEFSRDLFLDKCMNGNNFHNNRREEEEDDEVELSLGLSLNGRFGVPKKDRMKLIRSSSVSTSFFMLGGEENHAPTAITAAYEPLSRSCSLPMETEMTEERRKRKQLQSLRRMEAKRRRMEKIKILRVGREKVDSEDNSSEENGSNGNSNGQGLVRSINGNRDGDGNGINGNRNRNGMP